MKETELDERVREFAQLRNALDLLVRSGVKDMTITEIHGLSALWPDWTVGTRYGARQIIRFEERPYMVLADVVAQDGEDNRPDKDTDHYKLMSDPDENGVFPFSMPLGDSDAYGKGDKVSLQGVVYESQIDGNKSIPGVGDGAKYWLKV